MDNEINFFEIGQKQRTRLDFLEIKEEVWSSYHSSLMKHIEFVREAGKMIGVLPMQLEIHDNSKFSIAEFPSYAKHFFGGGSPDDFSKAWLHHIHNNPHHWQHWIYPQGFTPKNTTVEAGGIVFMPQHYALEMIADWMGASMAYTGSWDMQKWLWGNMPKITLHSETARYVRSVLDFLGYADTVYIQRFAHEAKDA